MFVHFLGNRDSRLSEDAIVGLAQDLFGVTLRHVLEKSEFSGLTNSYCRRPATARYGSPALDTGHQPVFMWSWVNLCVIQGPPQAVQWPSLA